MKRHERLTQLAITLATTALVAMACTTRPNASTPTQSAQISASPKPVATAAAAPTASLQPLEITGKVSLDPAHGPWDMKVTATASGLRPGTAYDVVWTTASGAWKLSDDRSKYVGREYKPVQKILRSVVSDDAGAFTTTFSVPQ